MTDDLAEIGLGAIGFLEGGVGAGKVVDRLGYKIGPDVVRGGIQGHHAWPKFLGGAKQQDLSRQYQSIHGMIHADIAKALKQAGFPPVGGRAGGTERWIEFFRTNPGKHQEALDILGRVTRAFDKRNGTNITRHLDDALAKGNPERAFPPPRR